MEILDVVYKYRNWSDPLHKKILTENELFFASPSCFNDPFDTKIFNNYNALDDDEYFEFTENLKKKVELIAKEERLFYHPQIIDKLLADRTSLTKSSIDVEIKAIEKHLGIISFSTDPNNLLLWSHYGDYHRGISIGFFKQELIESKRFGHGDYVEYPADNGYPIIDPRGGENSFMQRTFTKSKDWQYESEFRLLKIFKNQEISNTSELRKEKFETNWISEICLGLNMDIDAQNEVISICSEKNIPCMKMTRVPNEFRIIKVQISKALLRLDTKSH